MSDYCILCDAYVTGPKFDVVTVPPSQEGGAMCFDVDACIDRALDRAYTDAPSRTRHQRAILSKLLREIVR